MIYCTSCGPNGELQIYNGAAWTNVIGTSARAASAANPCGAYVAAGVWKEFLCHNLGADTSLDPNIPVQGINGNFYQWGRINPVATSSTPDGSIVGWNTVTAANGAWNNWRKTANDPCPAGFRVPTKAQWEGVLSNNPYSRTGTWVNDGNFTTALQFGMSTIKTLTLPASGNRSQFSGLLRYRGRDGYSWASNEQNNGFASSLGFDSSSMIVYENIRSQGFPIRCISE